MTGDSLRDPSPNQLPTRNEAEALRRIRRWRRAIVVMWVMTLPVIFAALYAWPDGAFVVVAFWFGLVVLVAIKVRGAPALRHQRSPSLGSGLI